MTEIQAAEMIVLLTSLYKIGMVSLGLAVYAFGFTWGWRTGGSND